MKTILVYGEKTFKISVPDGASITFGPFSPPKKGSTYADGGKGLVGTLRVYEGAKSTTNILAVFSGVTGFRDLSLDYEEEVAREEGAVIWKSDKDGYTREEKVQKDSEWITPITENSTLEDE